MAQTINTYTGSTVIPSEDLAPWSWDTGSHSRASRVDFQWSVLLLGGHRQWWLVEEQWAVHHPGRTSAHQAEVPAVPADK